MATLLGIMIPLFGGMLIPVWIPLIGVAVGAVVDRVRPARPTPAMIVVEEAKRRTAELMASVIERPSTATDVMVTEELSYAA